MAIYLTISFLREKLIIKFIRNSATKFFIISFRFLSVDLKSELRFAKIIIRGELFLQEMNKGKNIPVLILVSFKRLLVKEYQCNSCTKFKPKH